MLEALKRSINNREQFTTMLSQLLLSKQMLGEAIAYADRGDSVSSGIAISMLQDSAEMLIWILIKKHGLQVKDQAGFVSNIETLQKASVSIADVPKLLELNKARIGFKHYGNLPAPEEAKKQRSTGHMLRNSFDRRCSTTSQ